MRKFATVIVFALLACSGKAQTMEETVKWISEKLTANMEGYYSGKGVLYYRQTPTSFTLDKCELIVKITEESSYSGGGSWYYDLFIPLEDLLIRNDGTFYNFGIRRVMTGTTYRERSGVGGESVLTDTKGWMKLNLDKEKDILERMRKAFKHLATFCPPKKAETF